MMLGRKKRSRIEDIRIMNQLFPATDAIAEADGGATARAEHLLIATFDLDTGSARRAFKRVGADPDRFRRAIREQHADAVRAVGMRPMNDDMLDRHIPPPAGDRLHHGSPSSHDLFRSVVKLVRSERSQLYGAYFVLVAAQTERGTTARALQHMNVDPTELAAAARTEIDLLNNKDQVDRARGA